MGKNNNDKFSWQRNVVEKFIRIEARWNKDKQRSSLISHSAIIIREGSHS